MTTSSSLARAARHDGIDHRVRGLRGPGADQRVEGLQLRISISHAHQDHRSARNSSAAAPMGSDGAARVLSRVMPAYVIAETDVHDPEQYERYKAASPGAIAAAGGRFGFQTAVSFARVGENGAEDKP